MDKPGISWRTAVLAALMLPSAMASAQTAGPSVPAQQQAARDGERLAILRDELARETRAAEEETRHRAERLAAHDPRGVEQSEQSLARHAQNLEALRREIDTAARQATAPQTRPTPPQASPARMPATTLARGSEEPPWWDVYGRRPGSNASAKPADLPSRQPAPVQSGSK